MEYPFTRSVLAASILAASPALVSAQEGVLEEVIVTAQKRQQSVVDVPMSISAFSGNQLEEMRIESVAELQKIVPGFRYSESNGGTPIFYIRGIGFNEQSLGSLPNVAVYLDEVPIAFPVMTGGVVLDLERVEVLKGPQGTLFGQNTTGGAVNYIAAKPGEEFSASLTGGLGNYDYRNIRGHISGGLTDTLTARAAVSWQDVGPWQESSTSGREMGDKDKISGRVIVNWAATDALNLNFTYNGYRDKSDVRATQFQSLEFQQEQLARTYLPQETVDIMDNYPTADKDNQSADWGPDTPEQDNEMDQLSARLDWDLSDAATLTYIYSTSEFEMDRESDPDGMSINNMTVITVGDIEADFHELRLAGSAWGERAQCFVGFIYDNSEVDQIDSLLFDDTGNGYALVARAGGNVDAFFNTTDNDTYQEFTNSAIFGGVDYNFTDTLAGHASARYTDSEVEMNGCTRDANDGVLANAFNIGLFGGAPVIQTGGCITLDSTFTPVLVEESLEEDNTSWRLGLSWTPTDDSLYYFNISQGYKGGSFPNLSASAAGQFVPVTQESLLAYEGGLKLTLLENTLQTTAALFYYDYEDKQVLGRVQVPVFGPLAALVNVPDSDVTGAELQVLWRPTVNWRLSANATWLDTELGDFQDFDGLGNPGDFTGESFPNTPEIVANLDAQYDWDFNSGYVLSLGGNIAYQDETNSSFGELEELDVDSYTVMDLRANLISPDGNWNVLLWGANVTDEYYWISASRSVDSIIRVPGQPRSYGVELTYRFE